MKIIKKGRKQKGWSIKKKCTGQGWGLGGCGSLLLVEQEDLFTCQSFHYDGSDESYVSFTCINCGVKTDLNKNELPPIEIIKKLPNKSTIN